MQFEFNTRSAEHLIRLILNRNGNVPNYAVLLGAGASVSSAVRTAEDMIETWRSETFSAHKGDATLAEWLKLQPWCGSDDEYATLFERKKNHPPHQRKILLVCVMKNTTNY